MTLKKEKPDLSLWTWSGSPPPSVYSGGSAAAADAAAQIAAEMKECLESGGGRLGEFLATSHFVHAVLCDAGYMTVPIVPSPDMERAFNTGLFKPFIERYRAMLDHRDSRFISAYRAAAERWL